MLYAYGKLRKMIEKVYDSTKLAPISGPEIIDMIELDEIGDMTTLVVLGSDFAAVGATASRLRKAAEIITVPLIIITESMSLVENKKPNNYRVIIREEKSKKADILKVIIDNYAKWEREEVTPEPEIDNGSEENELAAIESEVDDEVIWEELANSNAMIDLAAVRLSGVTAPIPEEADSNLRETAIDAEAEKTIEEQEDPDEEQENTEGAADTAVFSRAPNMIVRTEIVEKNIPTALPLYNYEVQKLPRYSPMKFDNAEDIIAHFRRKWKVDGVME